MGWRRGQKGGEQIPGGDGQYGRGEKEGTRKRGAEGLLWGGQVEERQMETPGSEPHATEHLGKVVKRQRALEEQGAGWVLG